MNNDRAFKYIKRREIMSKRQAYVNIMVNKLNEDDAFKYTNISFYNHNNFHFVERFNDYNYNIEDVLPKVYNFILRHRCEIIYFVCMNKQKRLVIELDDYMVALFLTNNRSLGFRTFFPTGNKVNKYNNRDDIYIISNKKRYYE